MADIREARLGVIQRILEGDGESSRAERRNAFEDAGLAEPLSSLIHKVAVHSWKVTESDIEKARAAGFSEDQIFELVVCAAIGQSSRQYESAMDALDAATKE